jgi:hypothetical protein
MPANRLIAGTKNFCPGTRMARSYNMSLPIGEAHEQRRSQSSRGFSWEHKWSTKVLG